MVVVVHSVDFTGGCGFVLALGGVIVVTASLLVELIALGNHCFELLLALGLFDLVNHLLLMCVKELCVDV